MFRTIIWLLCAVIILIILLPVGLLIRLFSIGKDKYARPPKAALWVARNLVSPFVRLAGCDYEIRGCENLPDGPALFIGNHQGDLDVLLIFFALGEPKIVMAKKEAKKVPIAHLWMTIFQCIFIDRKDMRQSLACIKEAEDYLLHERSVLIFPEGTRSQGPDMNEFKLGAFKIATKTGVPVVPFVIDGSYKVFERQRYLKKSHVDFSILPAVLPNEGEKASEFSQRVQHMIAEELTRLRNE